MSAQSRSLAARIWSAFPVSQPAFARLLQLLDIEATTRIPTACVTFGARSRLLVNPFFVEHACRNDAELVMLVLHELHHVVMGHTQLFPRVTRADNFAFDAVINAHLCHLFENWQGTSLFRHTYAAAAFPEALLRPPEGWRTREERWALKGRALAVHKALYSDGQVSYSDVLKLMPTLLVVPGRAGRDPLEDLPLLGNHEDEQHIPADLMGAVRGIVARWPMVDLRSGRDQGGPLSEDTIQVAEAQRGAIAAIRRAVLKVAQRHPGTLKGGLRTAQAETLEPFRTRADRRGYWREAGGEEVLLWRGTAGAVSRDTVGRVHLYVDVSGSMADVLPLLYGAIVPLLEHMHPRVHLFSTEVVDVDHAALRRGVATSTGGTDIADVTQHMLRHDVRRAVIATDGWVGAVPQEHVRLLAARRLRVAGVITHGGEADFLGPLHGHAVRLPQLSLKEAA